MNGTRGIGMLLARNARHRGEHTAVVAGGQRLSYRQFAQRVDRLAGAMAQAGVGHGDKVATLLPNCLELLDIYWAAARIGAVVVPLSPMLLGPGLRALLHDAEPRMLFASAAMLDAARGAPAAAAPWRSILVDGAAPGYTAYGALLDEAGGAAPPMTEVAAADACNIMYTSGTTGMPKGIVLSHAVRAQYGLMMAGALRIAPESVILQTGSLVFNGAFVTLMACFHAGARYVLHHQFDAQALLETIAREQVTHIMLVPSQIIAMLAAPGFDAAALQSLRMVLSLGAPLHATHKQALQQHLPGRFHELYGLTEGFLTILDGGDALRKAGSVGCPPAYCEMKIVADDGSEAAVGQVGEIAGRGPLLMDGYFKRPDLTAQAIVDGWLHSGDLGYVDEDGFLYLVDRKKDMIDSGGVKVYPRDIEEIVMQHPDVQDAAVFGVPHPKWGEAPVAAVLLRQPGCVSAAALCAWVNARVGARYQRLQEVVVLDAFPRSVAGKTLKRELRDPYWVNHGAQI